MRKKAYYSRTEEDSIGPVEYPPVVTRNDELWFGRDETPARFTQAIQAFAGGKISTGTGVKALPNKLVSAAQHQLGKTESAKKAFVTSPITRANLADWCDTLELGYDLQPWQPSCHDMLINWADAATVMWQRCVNVPIFDWREWENIGTYDKVCLDDVLCGTLPETPQTHPGVGKCEIKFKWVDKTLNRIQSSPHDIDSFYQDYCRRGMSLSILGEKFDPDNERDWLRLEDFWAMHRLRRLRSRSLVEKFVEFWDPVKGYNARHPELTGNCTDLLAQPCIQLPNMPTGTVDDCDENCQLMSYVRRVEMTIERELDTLKYKLRCMRPDLQLLDPILVMNWEDARCWQWAKMCSKYFCGVNMQINVQPGGLQQAIEMAQGEFSKAFTTGRYGAGFFHLPISGMNIDIWACEDDPDMSERRRLTPLLPRGKFYIYFRGWSGNGVSNTNAFRYAQMGIDRPVEYFRTRGYDTAQRLRLMNNNTVIAVNPANGCGNKHWLWNDDAFSNAAWLHRCFQWNIDCEWLPQRECFRSMPSVSQVVSCAPMTCSA